MGWGKSAPLQVDALAAHAIGGIGLIRANWGRLTVQREGRTNTGIKLVLTLAAVGTTFYSAAVGMKMADHASEGAGGATEPGGSSSKALAVA